MAFIFPSMKIHESWLVITRLRNLAIRVSKIMDDMKARKVRVFVIVEINSAIAKLTVWHNW